MGTTGSRVAAGLALLMLSSCLGRTPAPVFYTLSAVIPPAAAGANDDPITLAVGPATLPSYLDRSQLVTRVGNRLSYDQYRRWAAPLESELLRVLGADLGALLHTDRVAIYPTEPSVAVDYRVLLQVEQFDGSPGSEVVLQARWSITRPRAEKPAAIGFSKIHQPAPGGDGDRFVQAHSEAVGALSREIAARLRSLRP